MKVVYAKKISDSLLEAQEEATKKGLTIEKIILSPYEFLRLCKEANIKLNTNYVVWSGIRIEKEDPEEYGDFY